VNRDRPPWRRPGWIVVLGALAVALGIGVFFAVRGSDSPARPVDVAHAGESTVPVRRQDITAILTLDGNLEATSHFAVTAPVTGRVVRRRGIRAGTAVSHRRSLFAQAGTRVRPQVAGTFVRWLVPGGVRVAAGVPVAEVAYSGFAVVAALPPEAAYRIFSHHLAARAQIINGPGPFDCVVLQSPTAPPLPDPHGVASGSEGVGPIIKCAVPLTIHAVQGLRALVAVRSAERHHVLTLPVSVVAGSAQSGEVSVVDKDGSIHVRNVTLGITDGSIVEIKHGLRAGERVLTQPPQLNQFR
jgi:biotin carboxyl carrier protein